MDDCNLDKLSIKPGKLNPAFNKNVTEYSVTLPSECENLAFDCLTSDSGASYSISNSDGGKSVPLKEGEVNEIRIEVTAEDGTVKIYWVRAKRLSAKDAVLSNLTTAVGVLDPAFSGDILEYYCDVPCNTSKLVVTPSVADSKAKIQINNGATDEPLPLNVGETTISILVTSPDGSNNQTYTMHIIRKQIPYFVKLSDANVAHRMECPVSLSPVYRPVTIKGTDPKHTFSAPVIDEITKTSKINPLNEMPLATDWRILDEDLDKTLSDTTGCIALPWGGYSENQRLTDLGDVMKSIPPAVAPKEFGKFSTEVPFTHTYKAKGWEKQLQQIFDESDAIKLAKAGDEMIEKYCQSLPQPGWSAKHREGDSPLEHLQNAAFCYASAIKVKPKDASLHLQLGLILEERYYAEDMLGLKAQDSIDIPSMNMDAKESSKEEECAAICKLRGVNQGAPLSLQLKAIDQEYHHLLDSGQGGKADHVQQLYAWKSKQSTQEGKAAQKTEDEESPLGQAYSKYLDALSIDETKAIYHYHLGRLLVVQGSYETAVKRLEAGLGWNAAMTPARFYLGLALALQNGGPGSRAEEAMTYLTEGLDGLLRSNATAALDDKGSGLKRSTLLGNEMLTNFNVYLLRGTIQLGRLRLANPGAKDFMCATDVFHTAALLASQSMCLMTKGDMYQQVEWALLDAHNHLLDILLEQDKSNTAKIADRCNKLSALIKSSTIPNSTSLTDIQQKTCQRLVGIQPCSSHALYLLGTNQLSLYDNDPDQAKDALDDAKKSFQASILLEGKPMSGEPPEALKEQGWWQEKIKVEEQKKAAAATQGGQATAAGRGGAAARGRGTGRGAPPARGGAAAGRSTAARGAPAAANRGKPAPARGGPAKPTAAKPGAAPGKPCKAHSKEEQNTKADEKTVETPSSSPSATSVAPAADAIAPLNRKTYHPRLGLARALSRTPEGVEEAKKYYSEVIDLAPEVHDAYIESADMLMKTDALAAVDILCKFPVADNPTFDDAYIFGEIVRVLMKHEKFDDARLAPNMIALGKVLGIGALEKYTAILDAKFKTDLLKTIYAGVNGKSVDDPDMQAFFKFKFWI